MGGVNCTTTAVRDRRAQLAGEPLGLKKLVTLPASIRQRADRLLVPQSLAEGGHPNHLALQAVQILVTTA